MPCPLCREKFTIPDEGFSGIQKNFDMEKLVCVRGPSAGDEAGHPECGIILCDVCGSEAAPSAPAATKHCFECQQNYCDRCSWSHAKIKATSSHIGVNNFPKVVTQRCLDAD